MKDKVSWFIGAIIYMAILYTLVKPGSKGTVIIGNLGSVLTDLVRGATGETYTDGSWSVSQ
jgi:hypothetical protein